MPDPEALEGPIRHMLLCVLLFLVDGGDISGG
jgi:hypothetical protein